jgi:hypothetical protein
MTFRVQPGTYYITLQVDRASWDSPGVADLVPIGLRAYGKDSGGRIRNKTAWKVGVGFAAVQVRIGNRSTLCVRFSTLAPAGARGILKISRVY